MLAWRHLSLFLAAFGASCVVDHHDPYVLSTIVDRRFLPDALVKMTDPGNLIDRYLSQMIDHLVSSNLEVRNVAMEALGSDLTTRLFARFFALLAEFNFLLPPIVLWTE